MQHLTTKATATVSELGWFSALASTWGIDRTNERVRQGAFEKSIRRWQASNKMVPLHYDHRGDPEFIVGSVSPDSMAETTEGLYVEGKLDLEGSEVATSVWRSMKNNTLSLSFGYLTTRSRKAADGVLDLLELEIYEISVVPHPANPDTRFLSLKAAGPAAIEIASFSC